MAPVSATIPLIVDSLVHLRRDKGLSVSAVKGYRSALNSVFILKGMDLADSREICTRQSGCSSVVGVVEGAWLRSVPLFPSS